MSFKDKSIIITDWTGKQLFIGDYDDLLVDAVLLVNRCQTCTGCPTIENECPTCKGTGYIGDFEVCWVDESDKQDCNVYEYINY